MFQNSATSELVLASGSPRRSAILGEMGIDFSVVASGVDEACVVSEPESLVVQLSELKAADVARQYTERWILGGDTIVVVNGEVLGKPTDLQHARLMLEQLSGKTHSVIGGVTLMNASKGICESFCSESQVTFMKLPESCIARYVASKEGLDKAGAYAIQGDGQFFVERIVGSYTNIVGLDAQKTALLLLRQGVIEWRK
ncbi:MAG: Maf family protein [Bdellovibrionota bacterium]